MALERAGFVFRRHAGSHMILRRNEPYSRVFVPDDKEIRPGTLRRIIGAEGYFLVGHLVDDTTLPIDDAVRPRIASGRGVSARDYLRALSERDEAKREFAAALADVDALLTPATQTAAIPVDQVDQASTPAHFTRFVNALELCALALPNGFTATGLPLSLQIVCRGYDEATALRVGRAYQQAADWHERRPPGFG